MTEEEKLDVLAEYCDSHDLDEEEYNALEEWVNQGNSPYTNPDQYCIDGQEVSFMKWYWILADPLHPSHRSLLRHRYLLKEEAAAINSFSQTNRKKEQLPF